MGHNIKKIVSDLISKVGIGKAPVVVTDIAEYLGLSAKSISFENNNILGMLNKNIIYVNSKKNNVDSRFTIAHEIGHYILQNFNIDTVDTVYVRDLFNHDEKEECEANLFASELLIPTEFLNKDLKKIIYDFKKMGLNLSKNRDLIICALAKIYFVSCDVMKFRIKNINLEEYNG